MRRHELSDEDWALIGGLFPPSGAKGGQWRDHRMVLNGLFWRLRTGAPWRDIPERYGPWQSIYDRFNRYRKDGTWDRIVEALQIRLDAEGLIDWDLWCIDGSSIRASRAAAGGGKKGGPKSPPTTRWAAAAADSRAKSTWLLTAREFPWPSTSPPDKRTNRRNSKKR
jgi:transposase